MTQPTILFQPSNHVGLGHVSRLLAIALAVRNLEPHFQLPFVIDGNAHGLIEPYGLPCLTLPGEYDFYQAKGWAQWPYDRRHAFAVEIASVMMRTLAPEAIVFDCFPHAAMAQVAVAQQVPVVICLRKLKDMSYHFDEIRKNWSLIRAILIPHTEAECRVPEDLLERTCFTGPIVRPAPTSVPPFVKKAGAKLMVISSGGGGFPGVAAFCNRALEAYARLRAAVPALEAVLVTGPLFQDWWDLRLVDGARVLPFASHLSVLFSQADLVVCQAGYNTVAEIVGMGVPVICVPAERESDDQFERAQRIASDRIRIYLGDDAGDLSALMQQMLARSPSATQRAPDTTGASLAAKFLLERLPREAMA